MYIYIYIYILVEKKIACQKISLWGKLIQHRKSRLCVRERASFGGKLIGKQKSRLCVRESILEKIWFGAAVSAHARAKVRTEKKSKIKIKIWFGTFFSSMPVPR
jgi:hypothetical protein